MGIGKVAWKAGLKTVASQIVEGVSKAVTGSWRGTGEMWRLLKSAALRKGSAFVKGRAFVKELVSIVWQLRKGYSSGYWRGRARSLGLQLQHTWVMNKSWWMPEGLRNSWLNLIEVPAAFNNWMNGVLWREHSFRLFMNTLVKADFMATYNLTLEVTQDNPEAYAY